jgi:hypothetical protein
MMAILAQLLTSPVAGGFFSTQMDNQDKKCVMLGRRCDHRRISVISAVLASAGRPRRSCCFVKIKSPGFRPGWEK